MRHITLQERAIQTPSGLKAALEDPILLQYYIIDADIEDATPAFAWKLPDRDAQGNWILSPVGGKRRIDYLLYKRNMHLVCINIHVHIYKKLHFVTIELLNNTTMMCLYNITLIHVY